MPTERTFGASEIVLCDMDEIELRLHLMLFAAEIDTPDWHNLILDCILAARLFEIAVGNPGSQREA